MFLLMNGLDKLLFFLFFVFSLQGTLELNSTLKKAEHHLYNYCKSCAWDYMNGCCKTDKSQEEDFLYQLRSLFVLR